jgi:translation initiation factor IF-2
MSESTTPRLMAAAKEFNIGKDTLVDFLEGKGFNKDELKPTAKITEDMYRALQQEFQSDKVAKQKSTLIDLPKGADAKKKKDEEDLSIKEKGKKAAEAKATPVKEETAPLVEEKVAPIVAPVVEVKEEPVKIDTPEVESPKVINKIDLSTIDSSTRPKKSAKKVEEKKETVEETKITAKTKAKKEEVAKEVVKEAEKVAPVEETPLVEEETVITKIQADKIEGPKVLGKIQLPVDSDTRPKREDKRKRKRIPVDNRAGGQGQQGGGTGQQGGGTGQGQQGQGGVFNRGAGQQGGGFNRGTGTGQQGGQGGGFNRGGGQQGQGGGFNRGGAQQGGGNRGGFTRGGNRAPQTAQDKEIDQKAIQEKIRETQAKLAGTGGRGKSLKAKYRKAKREEMADNVGDDNLDNKLQVTEFISVSELASLMDVGFAEVIGKCMSLGIMVSINQRLDAEVIELVSSEFGFEVEFIDVEKQMELEDTDEVDDEAELHPRPPIVTIMGHVDHGKTSLLDYIRRENVVAGEAGGITQHIGAYEVTLPSGKQIAFLDTPGHEAFTAMRARGAKVTDIAVIVIAADDAVMPQTKEAISHAQAAGVPMIFAINKIDRDGANPAKIYEQLAGMNVLVESWGGKYQSQELSAKQGLNVDALLEKILLEAEMLDLKANADRSATGTIIEASLDKGRGYQATILVQNGTLEVGDLVVSGQHFGRIKAMFDERNKKVKTAGPSTPVLIIGLNGAPQAGEKFKVYEEEAEAKEVATKRAQLLREQGIRTRKHITLDEIGRRLALGNFKELNLILKGDVDGSVEALSDSLQKLSTEEVAVKIVLKAVGQISESDVLLATASDAIIVGFNVRPSSQANKLAEVEGVEIKLYSIIYKAIEEIKSAMEGLLEPKFTEKIVANVEVREVYKFDKATVAGCFVTEGKIFRNSKIRIIRDGIVVYPTGEGANAELQSLKRFKDDVKEVNNNMECGLTIKNYNDLKVGDVVEAFEEEEVKRTL